MPKQSLADDFAATPPRSQKKSKCLVGEAIESHGEGEVIGRVVSDLQWTAPQIAKVLGQHNILVSASAITKHRRAECACFKAL